MVFCKLVAFCTFWVYDTLYHFGLGESSPKMMCRFRMLKYLNIAFTGLPFGLIFSHELFGYMCVSHDPQLNLLQVEH